MFRPSGIIPALVTPLDRDGELKEQGLRDLLDYVIAGGVHGVFVLGSSGEIYGLSASQKRRVVEITVEHVAGRLPVYAGASEITTRDCIATAQMAATVGGVSALSVLTPYFISPKQCELVEHYRAIAGSTDLPVILYTNPGRTQVRLSLDSVQTLATVENIVAIKESGGDLAFVSDLIRETPDDFGILMGRDSLIYAALVHGAVGAIAGTANIVPQLVTGIYNAVLSGDHGQALASQDKLTGLRNLVDRATFPVVLKAALRLIGIDAGWCFAPAGDISESLQAELAETLAHLGESI